MQANTLDEVIFILDQIIADCKAQGSRLGYFASLYRRMTLGVKEGVANGIFDDGPRMEKLDVVFANRYFTAYDQYSKGLQPTTCWQTAFAATKLDKLTVMQHLLLGVNAHINLDLGIAVAEVSTVATIHSMQKDYTRINDIIAGFFGVVQDNLTKIAFPMYFIKRIDPRRTAAVLNFSMVKARETAWNNALILSEAGPDGIPAVIDLTDKVVCQVANNIQSPGKWLSLLLGWIRWTEGNDIEKNIGYLNE
ncbi:MAG: DUF5995 family protein [Taibaiella sp.]|jgi:hypothetical protein